MSLLEASVPGYVTTEVGHYNSGPKYGTDPIYQQLDESSGEIRILHVDKTTDPKGRVQSQLKHLPLTQSQYPEYEAISWCWGKATKRKEIVLNGVVTVVPENAEQLLRHLCIKQGHTRVWLDAVCINQADNTEKGHQVAIMKDIYSKAERVLIWLGDDDGRTKPALISLYDILEQCKETTARAARVDLRKWEAYDDERFINAIHKQLWDRNGYFVQSECQLPSIDWEAVFAFFSSPWFSRLWVVQEVVLSREARCYRGHDAVPWNDIGLAATWMRHRKFWRYYNDERRRGIHRAANIWAHGKKDVSPTSLVSQSIQLKTSNPLDKVYALLGLLQTSKSQRLDPERLVPDYNKSREEVYTSWAWYCIETAAETENEPLYPLNIAHTLQPPTGQDEQCRSTPSWVPPSDWIDKEDGCSRRVELSFSASGGQRMSACHPSLGILRVRGVTVGVVSRHGPVISDELLEDGTRLARTMLSFESIASELGRREHELALTLTSGMNDSFELAKDDLDFFQDFERFKAACHRMLTCVQGSSHGVAQEDDCFTDMDAYINHLWRGSKNEEFFTTQNGLMGMGPLGIRPDDQVVILFGGQLPYVLRKEGGFWRLLGTAYVHGIMEVSYFAAA